VRAFVTGATGFVGSFLVERLIAEKAEVSCIVRGSGRKTWIDGLPVERIAGSLEDAGVLREALAGVDTVFHVAGVTRARSEAEYFAVNAGGTRRLAEAAGASLKRFVYVSSLAAVGPTRGDRPVDEETEPRPLRGYGASKLAGERVLAGRVPLTIVRPPAVYGPRDTNFLPMFGSAQSIGIFPLMGGPNHETSLIHIEDLIDGIWRAATTESALGRTYFLSGGSHRTGEIADALGPALGVKLRKVRIPGLVARMIGEMGELKWSLTGKPQIVSRRKIHDILQPRWTCSIARARRELGFEPKVDLLRGMRETADAYAAEGWIRKPSRS
jgi:nucleoside-diphosphate-sugar epimerase